MNVTDEMVKLTVEAAWTECGDAMSKILARAFLAKVAEHVAAAERERIAAYITRAAKQKREQAEGWWSSDALEANTLDEVAGWCRDDTIWKEDE